jgi:hypothetical protein
MNKAFSHRVQKHLHFRVFILANNKTQTTIILPIVLYGCETSSLTSREEYRQGTFENMPLRRISESKGRMWVPCPQSMARPRVDDGGTASSYGDSCEYIE